MIVDELVALLGWQTTGDAERKRFESGMRSISDMAQRMSAVLLAAGAVAATAMAGLGKSVIDTSAKFEGFETSLETIEGSAAKAKAAMDWVSKFAATTPYELEGVTAAFIKLRAYGFDPMDGTLKTLGDTSSAMGKPLMQAVEAFADAATFEFERLKEFGIKAEQKGDQVTFRWQQNGKEMTKVVKKNGKEVTKFLLDTFGNRFNGAMIRQSKTWSGMMSNLGDSWELFKKRIGDAGFFQHVKGKLAGLLDQIAALDENGTLTRWAKSLSDGLKTGFDVGWMLAERFILNLMTTGEIVEWLGGKIGDFLRYLSDGKVDLGNWESVLAVFGAILMVINPVLAAMLGLALATDDFLTYMRGGKSVLGDFIETVRQVIWRLKEMGLSFDSVGDAISTAFKSMGEWLSSIDWSEQGKKLGKTLGDGIKSALTNLANLMPDIDWGKIGSGIEGSIDFGAIGKVWYEALKAQFSFMGGLKDGLVQSLAEADWGLIGTKWLAALKAPFQLIKGALDALAKDIGDGIKGWFDGVDWPSVGTKIKDGILAAVVAVPAALIALFTDASYSDVGKAIGDGILSGLQSMGGAIKDWFAGLLPAWATEFFDFKTAKDGSLKGKAKEETDRRQAFEQATMPRGGDTPGLKNTLDQVNAANPDARPSAKIIPIEPARRARMPASTDTLPGKTSDDMGVGAKVMSALSNVNAHLAKMSGDAAARAVNVTATDSRQDNRDQSITTNTDVHLSVQMQQAAAKAADATGKAVAGSLKNVPRVASTPSF